MDRQTKELVKARTNSMLMMAEVECSLSSTGKHVISLAASDDLRITHVAATCDNNPELEDAVERMGGHCCSVIKAKMMESMREGKIIGNELPMHLRTFANDLSSAWANVTMRRKQNRTSFEKTQTAEARKDAWGACMTAKLRREIPIPLSISYAPPSVSSYDDSLVPAKWCLHYGHRQVAKREFSTYGWKFDDQQITRAIQDCFECFTTDKYHRSFRSGVGNWCNACDSELKQRGAHIKSSKHTERVRDCIRQAMRLFPGPRGIQ